MLTVQQSGTNSNKSLDRAVYISPAGEAACVTTNEAEANWQRIHMTHEQPHHHGARAKNHFEDPVVISRNAGTAITRPKVEHHMALGGAKSARTKERHVCHIRIRRGTVVGVGFLATKRGDLILDWPWVAVMEVPGSIVIRFSNLWRVEGCYGRRFLQPRQASEAVRRLCFGCWPYGIRSRGAFGS